MRAKDFFHTISYLQYPIMLIAMVFAIRPYTNGFESVLIDFNKMLVFMGLGVSFSTLQDTQKTQNKLSLKVYQNPTYARLFLIFVGIIILFFLAAGLLGLLGGAEKLKEISLGMLVMGIGLIGMLKSVFEMVENHGGGKDSGWADSPQSTDPQT